MIILFYLTIIALLIYFWIFIIKEIRKIARESKRDVTIWTIMAILLSPLVTIILLTCFEVCQTIQDYKKDKIKENSKTFNCLNESKQTNIDNN